MSSEAARRTPLHLKVYEALHGRIANGTLRPGTQLPTENELVSEFGVSRGTARQAVTRLVHEGLVERTAGRGTFVSDRRLMYASRSLLGFTEQIRATGREPSSSLINVGPEAASAYAEEFDFGPNVSTVLSIERVRNADAEPVALEHLVVPLPRFAGLKDLDLEKVSIYDTLEELFGVHLRVGDFLLDVEDFSDRQAPLLHEAAGTPGFLMHGMVFDQDDRAIVGVRSYYRRSKYSFSFSIPREAARDRPVQPPQLVLLP